jgi:hypothetical protein
MGGRTLLVFFDLVVGGEVEYVNNASIQRFHSTASEFLRRPEKRPLLPRKFLARVGRVIGGNMWWLEDGN